MSVGRQLCSRLIDMAEDLRRYGDLLEDFEHTAETQLIIAESIEYARKLEGLVPKVLTFEGEVLPQLTMGEREEVLA